MATSYVTAQEYRKVIKKTSDLSDEDIDLHLEACTQVHARETGQSFGKDALVTTRRFLAKWVDRIDLDYEGTCPGIATAVGLVINVDTDSDGVCETTWAAADYWLKPFQALQEDEPRPYTRIETPRYGQKRFVPGNLVEVTAIFGWPSVPAAVKSDIIELCGIWRSENPRSTGRINELDQIVSTSPMALSLVKRFQNAYNAGVTF